MSFKFLQQGLNFPLWVYLDFNLKSHTGAILALTEAREGCFVTITQGPLKPRNGSDGP